MQFLQEIFKFCLWKAAGLHIDPFSECRRYVSPPYIAADVPQTKSIRHICNAMIMPLANNCSSVPGTAWTKACFLISRTYKHSNTQLCLSHNRHHESKHVFSPRFRSCASAEQLWLGRSLVIASTLSTLEFTPYVAPRQNHQRLRLSPTWIVKVHTHL